jgi:uncharacterized membrane protein YhaH (DUF805 family)
MQWYTAVLKNYAGFSGRACRQQYWMFTLYNLIAIIALVIISGGLATVTKSPIFSGLYRLYLLAVFLPSLAVTIRRLHDTDRSGGWVYIALIPFFGLLVLLIFAAQESTPGENRFGPALKRSSDL